MKQVERLIFGLIAPALSLIALQPFAATASRPVQEIFIGRVGGYTIGPALSVINNK